MMAARAASALLHGAFAEQLGFGDDRKRRIDELIESKLALAQSVVGAGEQWLTELGTDELRDLMTLRVE